MEVQTVDYGQAEAGRTFVDSLRHTGFAVVANHTIGAELLRRIYQGWLAFFQSDDKFAYLFQADGPKGTQEGYIPMEVSETAVGFEQKDLKEFYHVMPDGRIPDALFADITEYRRTAFELGKELVDWIEHWAPEAVTAKLSERLSGMLSDEASMLRVLHYPPLPSTSLSQSEGEHAVRAAAHEDINIITLLPASEQPGLQVQDAEGQWIDLASRQGDLIVNTGDMLHEATDGYFPSTTHRVVNPLSAEDNVSRIAVPYFLTARADVVLSPRYTAGSYLAQRLEEINA